MRGLPNDTGARCWLNAAAQALLHCPPLVNYALSAGFAADQNARRSNACAVANAFAGLARAYWDPAATVGPATTESQAATGVPAESARLFAALTKVYPRLARGQQDAHEGLVLLLGSMHDAGARAKRLGPRESATSASASCDAAAWAAAPGGYSFLAEIFQGQSRLGSELDHWWCLSLAITDSTSVQAAIARHHGPSGHVTHAPPCLVVHLKRFDGAGSKIDKFMSYGADLTVPLAPDARPAQYSLFAVVMQSGDARGGHYTCLAEHRGAWAFADDGSVAAVADIESIVNRDAYVLLFKRRF
jgi:ubiquitin C-terminal hydrolase